MFSGTTPISNEEVRERLKTLTCVTVLPDADRVFAVDSAFNRVAVLRANGSLLAHVTDDAYAVVDMAPHDNPLIITRARVVQLGNDASYNNVGVWGEASVVEPTPGLPEVAFLAEVGRTTVLPPDNSRAGLHVQRRLTATMTDDSQSVPFSPVQALRAASIVDLRLDMRGGTSLRSSARIDGGLELVLSSSISEIPTGRVALRTHNLAVAFDYVIIVERSQVGASQVRPLAGHMTANPLKTCSFSQSASIGWEKATGIAEASTV